MTFTLDRRRFLEAGATGAVLSAASVAAEDKTGPNEKIQVGVMGVNGRGSALTDSFTQQKGVEVAYICDVDERAIDKVVNKLKKTQQNKPQGVTDFRRILDDKNVDVLVVAAPNHWHAPATILACKASKHVYVEKPCSHTAQEGELAVAAARRYDRVVQMGNQRRTRAPIEEAIERVHRGDLGKVLHSRTWFNSRRESIGKGKPATPPSWLDYALWQGPAPERPYKDNLVHYNWHWHWHWGNGELGNNGVHGLDVARWGLNVDYPTRVTSAGGRYRFDDDQETPDTHMVTYEFGERSIIWEGLSWSPYGPGGSRFGITFHGDKRSMLLLDTGYTIFDMTNKEVETKKGSDGDARHIANFLDCMRQGGRPNSDIEEGHKSTLLCHLGNISHRVGRALTTDPQNGHIVGDEEAQGMWGREYRKGWEPTV